MIIGNIEWARAPNDPDTNWDVEEIEKMNQKEENMNGKATTENLTSENLTTEKMTVAPAITKDRLIKMQKADNTIQDKISNTSKEYLVENGLVYRNGTVKSSLLYKQIVVPEKLKNDIMKLEHESKMSGHLGNKKSLERIRNHFFWPGMTADVKKILWFL